MKTTPLIKRLFASVFTAVTFATLATVSLNQSTFAAVVDEGSLEAMDPVENMMDTIDDISNGTITTTTYDAAIYNYDGTITTINNVKIDLSGEAMTFGIYNNGMSSITTISNVDIQVSASNGAYGIFNSYSSTIGTITGADIKVYSASGIATGFYIKVAQSSNITSFSGNITATTDDGTAKALELAGSSTATDYTFNFNGDTTLTATSEEGTAYALYVGSAQSYTLTAASYATKISLTGDIYSSIALTLDSGNYVLSADTTVTATSLSINEGGCLTLTGETTFALADGTLTLNVDTLTAAAMLIITEGASIDGLTDINIVLSGEAESWTGEDLALIAAADATALDGITFTVYDSTGYFLGNYDSSQFVSELATIPEPSTATLSLLALAGLCIRRRRKAA